MTKPDPPCSGTIQHLNEERKKAGYRVHIQVGRQKDVEMVPDEVMERHWWEDQVAKHRGEEKPSQGAKLYDITAMVEEIRKDGVEGVTEEQRQEIREIQHAKQEVYMDPGRLAMINGETYHPRLQGDTYRPARNGPAHSHDTTLDPILINPHAFLNAAFADCGEKFEHAQADAARKQDMRGCWTCFKLRRSKRVCDKHRNTHDNILTAVPLCPHIDMRLFWYADDPANKKNPWLLDVSEVHPQDVLAHKACVGKIKSALDGAWDLVKLLEQTMERRKVRAPNVYRMIRQLDAVWELEKTYKGKEREVPGLDAEFFQMYYSKEYEQYQETEGYGKRTEEDYWKNKALMAEAEKVDKNKKREVKREGEVSEAETKMEARKAGQKVEAPTSKTPVGSEPTSPSSPKTTNAPGDRFKLSKTTPKVRLTPAKKTAKAKSKAKKASPKKEYEGKKSDLSEEFVYDSDKGLEDVGVAVPDAILDDHVPTPNTVQKKEVSKRKRSDDGDVRDEEPSTKKQKSSKEIVAPMKVAPKRKVSEDSDVYDEQPPTKKQKATPKDKATQHSTPGTKLATPDVTQPSELSSVRELPSQLASPKKRKASSSADNATASVSTKKRKISIGEEGNYETETVSVSPADSGKNNELDTTTTSSTKTVEIPAISIQHPTPPATPEVESVSENESVEDEADYESSEEE